ncbi:hypothetical protein HDU76_007300, partial [Blyttiomyces sp. JEL0837]
MACRHGHYDLVNVMWVENCLTTSYNPSDAVEGAIQSNNAEIFHYVSLKFPQVNPREAMFMLSQAHIKLSIFQALFNDPRLAFTESKFQEIFWDVASVGNMEVAKYLVESNRVNPIQNGNKYLIKALKFDSPQPLQYLLSFEGISAKANKHAPLVLSVLNNVPSAHVKAILFSTEDWRNITDFFKPRKRLVSIPDGLKCFAFLFAVACEHNNVEVAIMLADTGLVSSTWAFDGRAFLGAAEHGATELGKLVI